MLLDIDHNESVDSTWVISFCPVYLDKDFMLENQNHVGVIYFHKKII